METLAMDIVFDGKDAVDLCVAIKEAILVVALKHKFNANMELTGWDAAHPPITINRTKE